MKKKGFTLVELLVVITIIGLLTVITVPSIITINKRIRQKENSTTIKMIKSAAKMYGRDKKSALFGTCEETDRCCARVSLQKLINTGYYEISKSNDEIRESLGSAPGEFYVIIVFKNKSIMVEDYKEESYYNNINNCRVYVHDEE